MQLQDLKDDLAALKGARALITDFEHWCQGNLTAPTSDGHGAYCALGAVRLARIRLGLPAPHITTDPDKRLYDSRASSTQQRLERRFPMGGWVVGLNDGPPLQDRKDPLKMQERHELVLGMFDEAINDVCAQIAELESSPANPFVDGIGRGVDPRVSV